MAASNAKSSAQSAPEAAPIGDAELAQRYSQVQTLLFGDAQNATTNRIAFLEDRVRELEQATKDRHDELAAFVDKVTTEMAKTADKRFADLENELEARDRRQTQHRKRMVSTLGESIKGLAKDV